MTEVLIKGPSVGVYSEKTNHQQTGPTYELWEIIVKQEHLFWKNNIAYLYIKNVYIYIRKIEFLEYKYR